MIRDRAARKKKLKKYPDEKIHKVRVILLAIIALAFFISAGLSVFTLFKTKEIVDHPGIYGKHRDYACSSQATEEGEIPSTGARQLLTYDPALLAASKPRWSAELNSNPTFSQDNPNELELPAGYRYTTVGAATGVFLHNKLKNTLDIFATMPPAQDSRAGWYMEYFPVEPAKQYVLSTSYSLEQAQAVIVAEELDASGNRSYTDLSFLAPAPDRITKELVFIPRLSTVQMRFFTQLSSTGSMTIYEESAHAISDVMLKEPLVSLSFDDGWRTIYELGKPVLDSFDYKSTQFIIGESFRSILSGYMNLSEVKQMQKEGHEIASHSLRHCNLAHLSEEDAAYDVAASKATLQSEFKPIRGLAYPYGSSNPAIKEAARKQYDYLRTTEAGYASLLSDRYELRAVTVLPGTSFEEFKNIVDFAIENRLWLDLVYHKVELAPSAYGINPEGLRQQLAYLKSKDVSVVTIADGIDVLAKQQRAAFANLMHESPE